MIRFKKWYPNITIAIQIIEVNAKIVEITTFNTITIGRTKQCRINIHMTNLIM